MRRSVLALVLGTLALVGCREPPAAAGERRFAEHLEAALAREIEAARLRLDAFVRTGVTFSSRDDWKSEVALAGAPSGVNGFTTELPMDQVYGRLGLGFQLTSLEHNVQLRAEYNGDFSSHTTRHGGLLRVSLGF